MDNPLQIDLTAVKERVKATWLAGDFDKIARYSEVAAEQFVERRGLLNGVRVLDVACGTGNVAIPAARKGAHVTGVDIAPPLLERACIRALNEGLQIIFDEGDVEALPYSDGSFELVTSMFGVMFSVRPQLAAAEMCRVCCTNGVIALANWTEEGFVGQLFKLMAKYRPPTAGLPSPMAWSSTEDLQKIFDGKASIKVMKQVDALMTFPFSVRETVEYQRQWSGPIQNAFCELDENDQRAMKQDLEKLYAAHNRARNGTTMIAAEYLDVSLVADYGF